MNNSKEKKIAIVIVNWNGHSDTIECLNSIQDLEYGNYDVIVVDNGSNDGSVQYIRKLHPNTQIVDLLENTGFAGGCNAGIEFALQSGAEYIFVLNNDTTINDKNVLRRMVNYLDTHQDIGMISPVVLYYNTDKIWFAGGTLDRNTGILKLWRQGDKYTRPDKEKELLCTFLAGCALFMRPEIWSKVKGFYEPYFLTSEESELCIQMMDMGYKLAVLEDIFIYHKVSQSMGLESPLWVYFLYRNKLLFAKRNSKGFSILDLCRIVTYYMRGFVSLMRKGKLGAAMGLIRGVLDFLLGREGKGYYNNTL